MLERLNYGALWVAVCFLVVQWADGRTHNFWIEASHTELCERSMRFYDALVTVIGDDPQVSPRIAGYTSAMRAAIQERDCPPIAAPSTSILDSLQLAILGDDLLERDEAGPETGIDTDGGVRLATRLERLRDSRSE
jgi:hypothetical protein